MTARKRPAPKLYELYVELEDIKPLIGRRILVPGSIKLPKLHDLLQLVMGWSDSHLHSFEFGKKTFSPAHDDMDDLNILDERNYTLGGVLGESIHEFVYEYDFGDSWRHRIKWNRNAQP